MTDQVKIQFLGTSAAIPSLRRGLPSLAILHNGGIILCDIGEGTQINIQRAGLPPSRIHTILISHLHGDHIFGLPGFLTSQQMMNRVNPLTIIGPPGIRIYYEQIRNISGFDIQYPLYFRELTPDSNNSLLVGPFQVIAKPLEHRILCFGYRLSESPKAGKFNSQAADELGIPQGPQRRDLQQGTPVRINGKLIKPEQVVGPPIPGRTIAYLTDTRPCANALELAYHASALIYDSTFSGDHAERAQQTFHSTSLQAAELARQAQVELLLLWHISIRNGEQVEAVMLQEARTLFPNTLMPDDFAAVEIFRSQPQ